MSGINFGVRKKLQIIDAEKRRRYIENINKESYEKHFGNRTIFERLGVDVDNDSGSVIRRELRQGNSTNNGKPENNQSGISQKNGNRGVQVLKFSNSAWYVVEKFNDFLNNYQVVERISNNSFDKIYKEIKENGRSGRIKFIQKGFDEYDKLNQSSYSLKTGKSSVDSVEIRHGRKNTEVVRMVENESQRGERTGSNGARDSSQSRSNKQGVKFSLTDSVEEDVVQRYGKTYNWAEI